MTAGLILAANALPMICVAGAVWLLTLDRGFVWWPIALVTLATMLATGIATRDKP